jgi:hypothetical protein
MKNYNEIESVNKVMNEDIKKLRENLINFK